MAEIRDMTHIAKFNLLAEVLAEEALKHFKDFHADINRNSTNPFYMMEWGGSLFENAAKWKFYVALNEMCRTRAEHGGTDATIENLREMVKQHFRPRGRHHSSSSTSNLIDAYLDEVVLDFIFDAFGFTSWFRAAQRKDSEYHAWWEQEAARSKAEAEAKAAAEALADARIAKAKERVRAAVAKGRLPDPADVMLGWPTMQAAQAIRNDELFQAVKNVHYKTEAPAAS